ncbi:capsular glucan synthase [Streptomyces jeddahensis]|uniref:D-inositol 3-phosphate glycosyltransferase n=2 Tax=Streptomyces jeddahensis TaxID=1716141 RepID=A0A177HV65_9ACTN|nr:capsular glucan synthase [Streptomyces jeddahensis]
MSGDARLWCDRLVRGLGQHEFDVYAFSRSRQQEDEGWIALPPQVNRVRTASLWSADGEGVAYGRRARRRFAEAYGELAAALCAGGAGAAGARAGGVGSAGGAQGARGARGHGGAGVSADGSADGTPKVPAPRSGRGSVDASEGADMCVGAEEDRFCSALYGLAELARDEGGLATALRSETAVQALERACRAPGAPRAAQLARVPDLLAVTAYLERALRPLSLDWYEDDGLGSVDLCHATSGGAAALAGLLAKEFAGVPLLVTEYGVQLRANYLAAAEEYPSAPVRTLLAAFHGRLAAEVYRKATLITPGNTHARRWQERCGADRAKLRTVYPGMEASQFAEVGESTECADPGTLVWVGRIEPGKDLVSLLHAFAEIRKDEPKARLRIVGAPADGAEAATYLAQCRALAAQLFPDEAEGVHAVGDNPVSFEELGAPEVPDLAEAYAAGSVVVLSSVVEGFPIGLVEAMFCGRATVSTDVGAVVEVIGGTGLVVPPRNPRALAEACLALLRDPERRARLGAAARARALELFTVEQNIAAFGSLYLEIVSHCPVRREAVDDTGEPLPFGVPPEAHVPGTWTAASETTTGRSGERRAVEPASARTAPRWVTPTKAGAGAGAGSAAGARAAFVPGEGAL